MLRYTKIKYKMKSALKIVLYFPLIKESRFLLLFFKFFVIFKFH